MPSLSLRPSPWQHASLPRLASPLSSRHGKPPSASWWPRTMALLPAALSFRFGLGASGATGDDRLLLGFSPPFPLGVTDALPGGGTHLAPFAFWNFRCGGGRRGSAGQHLAEFGNLSIDTELLLFKTLDGGVDDFGCEFVGGHIRSRASFPFRPDSIPTDGGDRLVPN